jgi:DNA-binding response OmpR family regulator
VTAAPSIIVCDDEQELAGELGEYFESLGWRVRTCFAGQDVEHELAAGFAPTCLLTDLRLGGVVDGDQLFAFARGLPAPLRPQVIAVITGHVVDRVGPEELGADLLYLKPVEPDAILADITRLAPADQASASTLL